MQAWTCRLYGGPDRLRLETLPKPVPGDRDVLVRIHATTVSSADIRVRAADFPPGMATMGRLALGWNGPRQPVLGTEYSGVVEAVGQGVNRFTPGERVFAFPGAGMRGHAEYALMPETGRIAPIPADLDFAAAAALAFGGTTALHYLRKADLQKGQSILVLGGSGAVGLAMIQLALLRGSTVTATTSARNRDLVAGFGATVIDYAATPLAAMGRFDVIADTVAATNFAAAQPQLHPGGRYLAIAGGIREMLFSLRPGPNGTRMLAGPASENVEDLAELATLAASGRYRPHIDRSYGFAEMPAAHAYVDTHRKRGSVVVTLP